MKALYERHLLPHLVHWVCGGKPIMTQRARVVPEAAGRVLDVGFGSGLNLAFYDPDKVELLWALEPSDAMRRKAAPRVARAPFEVRLLDLPGEQIPLDDDSVDCAVVTFTLCTIPDWRRALAQIRRVLKPGGRLHFCEHGEAPDASVRRWQRRLDPLWSPLAGGCHLGRPIPSLLEHGGFALEVLEAMYVPGPRFASYNYWGAARPR